MYTVYTTIVVVVRSSPPRRGIYYYYLAPVWYACAAMHTRDSIGSASPFAITHLADANHSYSPVVSELI